MTSLEEVKDRVGAELIALGVDIDHLRMSVDVTDSGGMVCVTWAAVVGSHFQVHFDLEMTRGYLIEPTISQVQGFESAIKDIAEKVSKNEVNYNEELCQFWTLEVCEEGDEEVETQTLFTSLEEMQVAAKEVLLARSSIYASRIVMTRKEYDDKKLEEVAAP